MTCTAVLDQFQGVHYGPGLYPVVARVSLQRGHYSLRLGFEWRGGGVEEEELFSEPRMQLNPDKPRKQATNLTLMTHTHV